MRDRRSFLCGLAALPLVGGSLALIGSPVRAAVPVTDELHARYLAWLQHEHAAALREFNWRNAVAVWKPGPNNFEPTAEAYAARCERERFGPSWWLTDAPDIGEAVALSPASSRAAVILSAAGVSLVGGRDG